MSRHISSFLPQGVVSLQSQRQSGGLSAGTLVLTLAGALPVEHLTPGDRIITRGGARTLRALRVQPLAGAAAIRISASALGVEQPEDDMLVAPNQMMLIRDWRAKALKGVSEALVAAQDLVDGEYIRRENQADGQLFTLEFDTTAVIYAGGVEVAFSPMTVDA